MVVKSPKVLVQALTRQINLWEEVNWYLNISDVP